MSPVVAVAGGTDGLGRGIVEALKAGGQYEIVVLSRKTNPELEKKLGVRVLAADYSSPDALVELLEKNKIWAILSTISSAIDTLPETNLIQAADRSKVTRRFIPNIWSGMEWSADMTEKVPMAAIKMAILAALEPTSLEWTTVYVGIFMDYYVPTLHTYAHTMPLAIDVEANMAAIPGSGDYPVYFTHTLDIGKFVGALLGRPKWERTYYLAADQMTFNELVRLMEEIKGAKFTVTYDSIESLEQGQMTALPGMHKMLEAVGGGAAGSFILPMLAKVGALLDGALPGMEKGSRLDRLFPDIKPLTLRAGLEKAYKGN
ncbi:hypothetical protein BDV95DRAFT_331579 [Massariosphaeria phaeospora]|uniref:NmrA-like domain-containing protein n=1 Tax=Massariosphaeria phaeospora TaxID=100035 RepID=A0A7C8IA04_9PLEO|nr:hypothetical protein BDV95DRAFT_331579 [Massariosphaeria phaeospora]